MRPDVVLSHDFFKSFFQISSLICSCKRKNIYQETALNVLEFVYPDPRSKR